MIVVLTLGRSGSSLLMQTLRELGVDVVGQRFRENACAEHYQGNLNGYFEDPEIYRKGLHSEKFHALVGAEKSACKMDLRHLVTASETNAWQRWESLFEAIFISVRDPSEQARSEYLGQIKKQEQNSLLEFQFYTTFLNRYARVFQKIASALDDELHSLKSKIHLVNYADSLSDPLAYVRWINTSAKLAASDAQITAAKDNIDSKLHRIKYEALTDAEHQWAQALKARDVFTLLTTSPNPWDQLLQIKKGNVSI